MILVLAAIIFLSLFMTGLSVGSPDVHPFSTGFSFAASGDLGNTTETVASLERLAGTGSSFFLALGDLSYEPSGTESSWCAMVKSKVGESYPFELLAGNHEDDARLHGWIGNFVQCLPDRLNAIGTYGAEYFFDYPSDAPLARFILISPGLTLFDVSYRYVRGDSHYNALASRIDEARAAGIPWIIVGMHKVCLSAGRMSCEVGSDVFNLLIEKNVDLILQGHDHTYQRSKQVALSPACPEVRVDAFDGDCVTDDGSDDRYTKGTGTVVVIDGTFGAGLAELDPNAPDAAYFVRLMASNTPGSGFGFTRFDVTETAIHAATNFSRTFGDAFAIEAAAPVPDPLHVTASASPTTGLAPLSVTFGSTVTGGATPYAYSWTFGDQEASSEPGPTHVYHAAGQYDARVIVTDSQNVVAQATLSVRALALLAVEVSTSTTRGEAPLTVSFSATLTGGRSPFTFSWTFGDAAGSSLPNPVHTYQQPGSFSVEVTVTDADGQIAVATVQVAATGPAQGPTEDPAEGPPGGFRGLQWTSPEFIGLFVVIGAVAVVTAWYLKRKDRPPVRRS